MVVSSGPVPLRDDQGLRSLSTNERKFALACLHNDDNDNDTNKATRLDGRRPLESRTLSLQFGRSHAKSTCTVTLGSGSSSTTRAVSTISCELVPPPNPDRPNDGSLRIHVDLSPMAAMGYENSEVGAEAGEAAQRRVALRVKRALERTLAGALDTEALCVKSGAWVWRLHVDAAVSDDGGNLLDACGLAVSANLRNFRLPCCEDDDVTTRVLHSDDREPTPLPLHHTPVYASFALFGDGTGRQSTTATAVVADPNEREELVADCPSLTFSFNRHGELCSMDFPGGCELAPSQLLRCAKLAEIRAAELCGILEEALSKSDERARSDRLKRLRGASTQPVQEEVTPNTPFVEGAQPEDTELPGMTDRKASSEEEEKYREMALDYAVGHVAAKVKEGNNDKDKKKQDSGAPSALLRAMMSTAALPIVPAGPPPADSLLSPSLLRRLEEAQPTLRTKEADDEFAQYAAKAATTGAVDSDDDEEVTVLRGEFNKTVTKIDSAKTDGVAQPIIPVVDEAVDDLALAVKKKKGAGKKKKRNKK